MANSTSPGKLPAKRTAKPAAKANAAVKIEKAATAAENKPGNPKKASTVAKKASPVTQKAPAVAKTAAVAEKPSKAKKPKLVRDSFTIPKDEYLVIDSLKQRSAKLGQPMKKSELLRAGIKILSSLDDTAFRQAINQVPAIKTGRPKTSK